MDRALQYLERAQAKAAALLANRDVRKGTILAALTLVYFGAGKLGLSLAFINLSASAVWPPTGLAIAALLILGRWVWPAIFVGAFLVNLTTAGTVLTSLAIATGNTLEGVLGAYLVERYARGRYAFERTSDVFRFAALAGLAAPIVSATMGVLALALGGFVPWATFGPVWATWWVGDAMGALVIAPLLILLANKPWTDFRADRAPEGAAWAVVLLATSVLVFVDTGPLLGNPALAFLLIPVAAWGTLRFGPFAAASGTVLVSAIAVMGTLARDAGLADETTNAELVLLQSFMGILSLTGLAVAALVHERKLVEANLQRAHGELEQRVRERTAEVQASRATLLEAHAIAQIGTWEWDLRTNAVAWNDLMYRIYGYPPDEGPMTFEKAMACVDAADVPRIQANIQGALAAAGSPSPSSNPIEYRITRPDGSQRTLHAEGRASCDAKGRPERMVGIVHDITDRVRAEDVRRASYEQAREITRLQEIAQLRSNFLSTTAHELNTPLTPIKIQLHMLRQATTPEQHERSLEILERNVARVGRIVQDVLEAARLTSGRLGLEKETVSLATILKGSFDSYTPAATTAHVSMECDVDPHVRLEADPHRLSQVLDNLLANAIKFTPPGGRVVIQARPFGPDVRVLVRDTGIGLTRDQMSLLFQPFSQVQEPATFRRGTGLGLYISKGIVELHGGRLWCESPGPNRGTTFVLQLPVLNGVAARPTVRPALTVDAT